MIRDNDVTLILQRVEEIKPLFIGLGADVVGAVLADLTAIWLAGHAPLLRTSVLDDQIKLINELTALNEHIIFGDAGHPATILNN